MNRIYIMPKVIFITLLLIFLINETRWYMILLTLLLSLIGVIVFIVLRFYILGKYYLRQVEKGKAVDKEKIYQTVHRIIKTANVFLRTEITVTGYENVDFSRNYLITPNHQSNQDILVIIEAMKQHILFVSKFSMSQVILIKDWMKLLGCLYLKKDDMRSQMIVMKEVVNQLNEGNNVVLFPEGRRSFGPEMNEFKAGAFKMALRTDADILPVTVNHVHKLRHHLPFKKTQMSLHFHSPISNEMVKDLSTNEISDLVKSIIQSKIED
jgi:1-acyl-sn-glycerol-3-phosphate acyltransferase